MEVGSGVGGRCCGGHFVTPGGHFRSSWCPMLPLGRAMAYPGPVLPSAPMGPGSVLQRQSPSLEVLAAAPVVNGWDRIQQEGKSVSGS